MYFGTPQSSGAAQGATQSKQFECTTGTQTYTQAAIGVTDLIGATILELSYDGKALQNVLAPVDFTFNSATGAITFVIIVNTGVPAGVLYQTAP